MRDILEGSTTKTIKEAILKPLEKESLNLQKQLNSAIPPMYLSIRTFFDVLENNQILRLTRQQIIGRSWESIGLGDVHVCVYICAYIYLCMWMYMLVFIYVHVYDCVYLCACICFCLHLCICMCIYIHDSSFSC